MSSEVNFVRQQGLQDATGESCAYQYPALMWQPRVIGVLVMIGLVLQAWPYFAALGILLWWNALVPWLNPFDALYNVLVGQPKRLPLLGPAPAPRRFAQGMAGTFLLVIGILLANGMRGLAWAVEALLVLALVALIFGRFCLGSYTFLLFTGRAGLANRTLPWARAEGPPPGSASGSGDGSTSPGAG